MKKKVFLGLAVFLLLSLFYTPAARAVGEDRPSRERNDTEIDIDESAVPLIELPTAEVIAIAAADESGAAVVALKTEQILEAVNAAASGDAVRITVNAIADAEIPNTVSVVISKESLAAIVEQTDAELEIVTNIGQIVLSNTALATIIEKAEGEDVIFRISRKAAEFARELLDEAAIDTAGVRIKSGSVTELDILSGGKAITGWDGAAALSLPVSLGFEQSKGYRVIQISADKSSTEHIGRCVVDVSELHVEISITHPGSFVVLADVVEENMAGDSLPLVASPLTARIDGGSDSSIGGNMIYMWLAAAGLALVAGVTAGVVRKRRQRG